MKKTNGWYEIRQENESEQLEIFLYAEIEKPEFILVYEKDTNDKYNPKQIKIENHKNRKLNEIAIQITRHMVENKTFTYNEILQFLEQFLETPDIKR